MGKHFFEYLRLIILLVLAVSIDLIIQPTESLLHSSWIFSTGEYQNKHLPKQQHPKLISHQTLPREDIERIGSNPSSLMYEPSVRTRRLVCFFKWLVYGTC